MLGRKAVSETPAPAPPNRGVKEHHLPPLRLFGIILVFVIAAAYAVWTSDRFQNLIHGVSQARLLEARLGNSVDQVLKPIGRPHRVCRRDHKDEDDPEEPQRRQMVLLHPPIRRRGRGSLAHGFPPEHLLRQRRPVALSSE